MKDNHKERGLEDVQKNLEHLDSEVDQFIKIVSEVRSMKDSVNELQNRLEHHEEEIEDKKRELAQLISSTNHLVATIEEQTKGVTQDLENKAGTLVSEVKSGISRIGSICEQGREQLQNQQKENMKGLSDRYDELNAFCKSLKEMVDDYEHKMNNLKGSYSSASVFYEKVESSLAEMKKTVYDFQKKPYEIENKLKKTEEHLQALIDEKYLKLKNITFVLLLLMIATIFFSAIAFYFR